MSDSAASQEPPPPLIRNLYFQLPEALRAQLLVRVTTCQPQFLQYILRRAGINGHRPETAATWLKGSMLKRIEQFLDGKDKLATIPEAVHLYFFETKPPISEEFFGVLGRSVQEGRKQTIADRAGAIACIRETHGDDAYLALFESWVHERCEFEDASRCEDGTPEHRDNDEKDEQHDRNENGDESGAVVDWATLDTELALLDKTFTALRAAKPVDVSACSTALNRANAIAGQLAKRLSDLAEFTGEVVPIWLTREEFIAALEQLSEMAASKVSNERAFNQARVTINEITRLLSGVRIRHRFPTKQEQFHLLAKRATKETAGSVENSFPLWKTLVDSLSSSSASTTQNSGLAWLEAAWAQEGEAAEKMLALLQAVSPALAELLAAVNWSDLAWPDVTHEGAAEDVAPVPIASASEEFIPDHSSPSADILQPLESVETPEDFSGAAETPAMSETSAVPDPSVPVETSVNFQSPANLPHFSSSVSPLEPATALESPSSVVLTQETAELEVSMDDLHGKTNVPLTQSARIWRLAEESRYGLAAHLVSFLKPGTTTPSWVFEAAILGPRVTYQVSSVSDRLTELFLNSADFRFEGLPFPEQTAARLLMAGAALRPALLAPQSNAASVLKLTQLKESLKLAALDAIVEAVAAFGLHREPLQPAMLRNQHDRAEWEQQLTSVRFELRDWMEKAPHRGFNFAPASRIWREWTQASGKLHALVNDTILATSDSYPIIETNWKPWHTSPGELIQSAVKENRRTEVVGAAREALIARMGEAADLANRLFALLAQAPRKHGNFREDHMHALTDTFRKQGAAASRELEKMAANNALMPTRVAANLCLRELAAVDSLLLGHIPMPGGDEPNPRWLVDAELLRDVTLDFTQEGTLAALAESSMSKITALADSHPDWMQAWNEQMAVENHAATAGLIEAFRWETPPGISIPELEQRRGHALRECQLSLETLADSTRRLLDDFVKLGLCREKDYFNWNVEVENAKREALDEKTTQFAPLRARLTQVRADIEKERDREAQKVQRAVDASPRIGTVHRERILNLLNIGDIHTANEYLDLAEHDRPLPEIGDTAHIFRKFFGEDGWLQQVETGLKQSSMQDCWQVVSQGADWQSLHFTLLGEEQRKEVIKQLELWLTFERQRRISPQDVKELAVILGLQPLQSTVDVSRPGRHPIQKCSVEAERLEDREASVVAPFGSSANGRYTLHLVWGELNADDLVNQCKHDTGDTSAHIVVCFRYLLPKDRHELAEVARKRFFKAVVVDRGLLAFVLSQNTTRFTTLLRTALPFSRVDPYTISAGAVPPEVFYGRRRELESLADPRGSCFVYGGRQLGKTALLRALERRFHQPKSGRAAVFVDLKSELFSRNRPVDDLWSLLVTRLKEANVFAEGVGASAGQEALFRHIRDWLDKDPTRRLLLLLDESDTFLEQDGKESKQHEPFPRCQRLKNLMETTDRRFKVVFAGLHNVQKSTRVSNHPLAHFGEAICVGPMLEEAESREARALVEEPLAAVGYFFDNPDAVSRILALTNYYPSLVQIFCHYLLDDLRQNHATRFSHSRSTPPCVITTDHVQRAYGTRVRQAIHEKVNLTLHLDSRYELIAYLLAFYHANAGGDGLDLRTIREEAVSYWPKGFEEMRTDDEFRSLLEEMIGLGILRQMSGSHHFALRNPNVMMLLGTEDEIVRRLEAAKDWEPSLRYEADKFRRVVFERPRQIFSPLTAQSESELRASENRVAVIYGLAAAGLGDLTAAMESDGLFGKARTLVIRDVSDPATFAQRLAAIRREPSHTLALIHPETPWDETWVIAAFKRIEQFTSKDAFLTVLFVADAARAAAVLPALQLTSGLDFRDFTLRPWHDAAVRRWLQDLNLGDEIKVRQRIFDVTGNWPILLDRLSTDSQAELLSSCDQLESKLSIPAELQRLKPIFGLADEPPDSPLLVAAESRRCTTEWVCEYLNIKSADGIRSVNSQLFLAAKLGLVTMVGPEWEFDRVAAKVLLGV